MRKRKYQDIIKTAKEKFTNAKYREAYDLYLEAFEQGFEVEDYISFGFVCIEIESFGRAQKIFDDVLAIAPHFRAYYGKAVIFEQLGQVDKAIEHFERAITEEPNIAQIYFDCAYLYDDIGKLKQAIAYYKKAIALEDNHFWSHLNLGSIYERNNDNEAAKNHFLKAYAIDATMPMINFNLGVIYNKVGAYDLALKHYLLELESKEPFVMTYYNIGLLYKDGFKDYENAKLYYLKGLEFDKNHYTLWYNLGCLYVLMDDYDNAYDCFFYLLYKRRELVEGLKNDEEIKPFLSSNQYENLLKLMQS